jgi:hypothetical protein
MLGNYGNKTEEEIREGSRREAFADLAAGRLGYRTFGLIRSPHLLEQAYNEKGVKLRIIAGDLVDKYICAYAGGYNEVMKSEIVKKHPNFFEDVLRRHQELRSQPNPPPAPLPLISFGEPMGIERGSGDDGDEEQRISISHNVLPTDKALNEGLMVDVEGYPSQELTFTISLGKWTTGMRKMGFNAEVGPITKAEFSALVDEMVKVRDKYK